MSEAWNDCELHGTFIGSVCPECTKEHIYQLTAERDQLKIELDKCPTIPEIDAVIEGIEQKYKEALDIAEDIIYGKDYPYQAPTEDLHKKFTRALQALNKLDTS